MFGLPLSLHNFEVLPGQSTYLDPMSFLPANAFSHYHLVRVVLVVWCGDHNTAVAAASAFGLLGCPLLLHTVVPVVFHALVVGSCTGNLGTGELDWSLVPPLMYCVNLKGPKILNSWTLWPFRTTSSLS